MPTYCIGKLTDAMIIGNTITFVVECGPEMVKGVEAEAVYANSAQGTVCLRGPCEGGYYGRGWSLLGNSGDQWIGMPIIFYVILMSMSDTFDVIKFSITQISSIIFYSNE